MPYLVGALLVLAVAGAVLYLWRQRKRGGCAGCANCGSCTLCQPQEKPEQKEPAEEQK